MRIFGTIRERKGSLQLSINAIVVLVMAMVVLGLGLGFVRGLFGQGQQNLVKVIDNNMLENQATYDTPFTVDRNVKVKLGKASPIYMGIYNKGSDEETFDITSQSCKESTMGDSVDYVAVVFPDSVSVGSNEAVGVRGSVFIDKNQFSGSYICEINAVGQATNVHYASSVFIEATGG